MNITAFGGGAPMWKFWVASATIGIGALMIWALAGYIEMKLATMKRLWEHCQQLERDVDRIQM